MHLRARDDPRIRPITDSFLTVYNYYGFGLVEAVYAGALVIELRDRGHQVSREVAFDVRYHDRHVAWQRIDMIVDGQVVVEVKAGETLSRFAEPQLCAYLAATSYSVGLLLHFGPAPRYRRIIYNGKRFGP